MMRGVPLTQHGSWRRARECHTHSPKSPRTRQYFSSCTKIAIASTASARRGWLESQLGGRVHYLERIVGALAVVLVQCDAYVPAGDAYFFHAWQGDLSNEHWVTCRSAWIFHNSDGLHLYRYRLVTFML